MSIDFTPWQRTAHGANLLDPAGRPRVTIFEEITGLANKYNALNLGQGFPDTEGPDAIRQIALDSIIEGANQYAPGSGIPSLRQSIATHQERFYGLSLDPETQVVVTTGATEAIAAAILAFVEPGDEVVTFEPYYDSYAAMIGLANAKHKVVQLELPDFQPDLAKLRATMTDKTRMIVLNNPHNPTGSVFGEDVLNEIIKLAHQHDCIILSDEVYEHLTFGVSHVPVATLPGGFERTITISSAGKSFSFTGWKVGWASGPENLITAVRTVKQFLTYSSGPAFQPAVAKALELPDEFFQQFAGSLGQTCALLADSLEQSGIPVFRPRGTYFLVADARQLGYDDATDLARMLPERLGVAAIPMSVFVHPENRQSYSSLLRFAFCKKESVIIEAAQRLRGLPELAR
ncbi:aminotransferase class I/II-fold pyridoxal phosphate-dependent enzyme [Glutamicibacter soli]|uniref:Aminotransferase class I/II-fold pyridoxal phosphate-dependent enzyme n=1 Tax=Glutamicibacter soli TaxID=453836 RepID=A0A6L9G8Q1_9MICC|nr:aminotransferase class I/II-fold pyridoxal phosphate-dependent enzyme [Glutamicibacter soli]NAZ17494.1 aminotransferase class I/II-fold pyridoxal phosphate-dependent enzyme [Glutamicibacter soli]